MSKNVVIISFYESYPPISGAATVTYNTAKYMNGKKYLFQLSPHSSETIEIDDSLEILNFKFLPTSHLTKAYSLISHFPRIVREIKRIDADYVILEGAAWVGYYLLLYWFLKFRLVRSTIIYHSHNVEYLLRKEKSTVFTSWLTKFAEKTIMKNVDVPTAVSQKDVEGFEKLYNLKPVILPNGVDVEKFEKIPESKIAEIKEKYHLPTNEKLVLFMGVTDYKPNKEAIEFLMNDVFPLIHEKFTNCKLVIIGGKIDYEKEWLINPGSIPFEDVPSFVKCCDICVSPIFSGSGTRLKILEYMAASKPVISTTKGAEGLGATDKKDILIANSSNTFVEAMHTLLSDGVTAAELAEKGKALVVQKFDWKKVFQDFNTYLAGVNENE
jgi:glycosyltransferase involved in cell wall biosynthesis